MKSTMKHYALPLAALLALLLLPAAAMAGPCAEVFDRLYPENANPTVRFVKSEAGNDITYGLEGELDLKKADKMLDWYRPSGKTDEQWFALSYAERKTQIGYKGSGMVKTGRAPEWLHEKLSSDPGGAEFMTKVTDKLETAMGWINAVEQQLGQGPHGRSKVYWQGNIAYKRDGAFSREHKNGLMGYVKATADYAQFGKLHRGYKVHQQNAEFIPGKNLDHSVLGPMNTEKVSETQQEIDAAASNRSTNRSSHYMQGTYFRTWKYGPDRNGAEVRDAHKDVPVLKRELRRLTHGLQHGLASYAGFKDLSMLDETAHFNKFSQPVQDLLRSVGGSYHKRHALPMRPFEEQYPQAMGISGTASEQLRSSITGARSAYVQTLESLAANRQGVDNAAIKNQVRVAIGKFAHDSGIYSALDNHFAQIGQQTAGR
jgi:hypothetical protein